MRFLPIIFALLSPAFAGLTFSEKVKDCSVPLEAASNNVISVDFPFTNRTAAPLTISKCNGSSGLRSEFLGHKFTYAPGESGILRTSITIGTNTGTINKTVILWMQGDPD